MVISSLRAPSLSAPGADGPLLGSASAKLVRRLLKSNASKRLTAADARIRICRPTPPAAASRSQSRDHRESPHYAAPRPDWAKVRGPGFALCAPDTRARAVL